MPANKKASENHRRDWVIIILILLLGLFCIIFASGWALRFAPIWELDASAQSKLDPDSDFLTNKPDGYFEPVDQAILTNVVLVDVFLTSGTPFPTNAQPPALAALETSTPGTLVTTQIAASPAIIVSATGTPITPSSATSPFVFFSPSPVPTQKLAKTSSPSTPAITSTTATPTATAVSTSTNTPTATSIATSTSTTTSTSTATPTATVVSTSTNTPTATSTATPTATAVSTSTNTPTATSTNTPPATNVPLAINCFLSPVTITASGSYTVPAGGACYRYTNSGFTYGGVFTVTELSGNSGNLTWYGKVNSTDTTCSTYPQAVGLSANGTVTLAVHKILNSMYIEISGATTSVQIDIVNWSDTGCQ